MKTLFRMSLAVALIFGLATACKDDDKSSTNDGKATMKFRLTDAPAVYDAVLIDIEDVEVHSESSGWVSLKTVKPGIYNLLDFRNGLDTLFAQGEVPAGKVSQIRLILGSDNSVVLNGISSPLKTPSAQQSGLKLQVNYTLEAGVVYEFWLDFDASRSIVVKGNGDFSLKPVIRVFTKSSTGSIDGYVSPISAQSNILAYSGNDSASAISDASTGYFLLSGLNPATYTVEFDPISPFAVRDTMGISVTAGKVTHLDTVMIR